jgi:type II secretory pathway component PulJ
MKRHEAKSEGFSLIEALIAMIMAAMVFTAVFAIYDQMRRASDSVTQKLDRYVLPSEILQKIAEDLDRIAAPGTDSKITVVNSFQSGLPAAQLTITSQMLDKDAKPQILEKVVWQTDYDLATGRLILYRSHSGLIWEDNLLDKDQRADWSPDRQLFVPICEGISYFKVQIPQPQDLAQKADSLNQPTLSQLAQNQSDQKGEEQQFFDVWNQQQLPPAITVTLSFAAPIEGRGVGGAEVPDEQKIKRTIVIDRSKKMNFVYVPLGDANHPHDANTAASLGNVASSEQELLVPTDRSGGESGQSFSDRTPRRSRRFRDRNAK